MFVLVGCAAAPPSPTPTQDGAPTASASALWFPTVPYSGPGASLLDIAYAADGLATHRLDLYRPTTVGPRPLVVFIHGGSWAIGSKAMTGGYGQLRDALLARGFAVASVEFRPSTTARFPAQLNDVKAALRFLRAEASALGLDPTRVALAGESSGGQLAQLAALTGDDPAWEGDVGVRDASTAVQAVVSFYGVSDLVSLAHDQDAAGCGASAATTAILAALLGGDPAGAAHDLAVAASPVTHARERPTPMLLLHGRRDCVVPPAQSRRLADALAASGTPVQLELVDAVHADGVFYADAVLFGYVVPFLERQLA